MLHPWAVRGPAARRFEVPTPALRVARQFFQRAKVQVIEELARGSRRSRGVRCFALADDLDPAAFDQRIQCCRRDGHAAHVFDVAASDRLAIRDDRECLQHRARIARRLFIRDSIQELLVVGLHAEAPARRNRRELDRALGPFVFQLVEHLADVVGIELHLRRGASVAGPRAVPGRTARQLQARA